MKTYQANLINSLSLIIMPLWAWFAFEATIEKPEQSITALIPLFLGVILLLCNSGVKKENKIIAHIAVLVTLIALIGLTMPLKAAILDARIAFARSERDFIVSQFELAKELGTLSNNSIK